VAGKIDALLSAQVPGPYVKRMAQVRRLYANPRQAEADYFRRTGIFPIMHVMVIREELYRRHRWVAQSLFKALLEAKAICIDSASKNDCIHSILPWAGNYLEQTRQLMGEDFWPYGVEPNRKTIETFLRYAREQGLTLRVLKPEDLFVKETLDTFRV
jgi:4,5-dihydroxyphthalate decarboxylase